MTVGHDEPQSRDDAGKLLRFAELRESAHFSAVVRANRAYLRAAVPHPESTERAHWVLTCLPASVPGRLSAISMKGMEVFVLHLSGGAGGQVRGFVNLRRAALERFAPVEQVLAGAFPGLTLHEDRPYRDAGDDQCRLAGPVDALVDALADIHVMTGVRNLAQDLLPFGTGYSRFHNAALADHVLGRA